MIREINEGFWIANDYRAAGWVLEREIKRAEADGWVVTEQRVGPASSVWPTSLCDDKIMVRIRCDRPIPDAD